MASVCSVFMCRLFQGMDVTAAKLLYERIGDCVWIQQRLYFG
jgi:hypothetical protein